MKVINFFFFFKFYQKKKKMIRDVIMPIIIINHSNTLLLITMVKVPSHPLTLNNTVILCIFEFSGILFFKSHLLIFIY